MLYLYSVFHIGFRIVSGFNTIFTEANSSWLKYESSKSIVSKLGFLKIDLHFLSFELVTPMWTQTDEEDAEIEIQSVTFEAKMNKCST